MNLKQLGSNQTQLTLNNGTEVFFSYETPVAAYVEGEGYLRTSKKWSVTTSKHINRWLNGVSHSEKSQEYFDNLID